MDKIKISQMTMEDLEGVYEIDKEAFPIPWRRSSFEEELKNVLATYLVAKIDENIVGYLGMWFIMDECHITNIAVSSNYRRMGIAKKLINELTLSYNKIRQQRITQEITEIISGSGDSLELF